MIPVLTGALLFGAALLLWPGLSGAGPPAIRQTNTDRGNEGGNEAPEDPALQLDLLGAMLAAGLSLPHAVTALAAIARGPQQTALQRVASALLLGVDWQEAWALGGRGSGMDLLRDSLRFGAATGAPSAAVLFAQADQLRRRRRQEEQQRAAALGTKLVLPLGLCALPSFIALGVVPVLVALVPPL
ncbi:type II secretion system F family protein [Arthrobacter sp. NPDC089319]|uniref:type II secretion system F family protein n=1 Tax=Arthrobacter sp. NPDC089319 TaxID=3155915 RepID=UPI0034236931